MKHFKKYLQTKGYAETTIKATIKSVNRFLYWLDTEDIPREQTSYNDVLQYIKYCSARGNTKKTISTEITLLKNYFNYLVSEEIIPGNPFISIKIHGIKRHTLYNVLSMEELEHLYHTFNHDEPAGKRNKIILGLMIYQGLKREEIEKLEISDIKLRDGKINVPGGRKSNGRILKLESHQIMDIQDYLAEYRKELLQIRGELDNKRLFVSMRGGKSLQSTLDWLLDKLRKQNSKVKDGKQIRVSVITHWLKNYNLRKAQYMAGHRYVSSTEAYKVNDLEDLQEEINKYHPIG